MKKIIDIPELIDSVKSNDIEMVKLLLSKGANPNITDSDEKISLHLAANNGFLEIITELVKAGANTEAQDSSLRTPIFFAARSDDLSAFKLLLNFGANINKQDHNGDTCLHLSALFGEIDVVETMLELGANPCIKNYDDCTPLDIVKEELKISDSSRQKQIYLNVVGIFEEFESKKQSKMLSGLVEIQENSEAIDLSIERPRYSSI